MLPNYAMVVTRDDGSFYAIDGTLQELQEQRKFLVRDIYGEVVDTRIVRRRPDW